MSMLRKRLKQLLHDARRGNGIPQRRTLDEFTIQIEQAKNGDVVLILECRNLWPSAYHLNDIFKHWPEPLPRPWPLHTMRKEGRIYRLVARWPRPTADPESVGASEATVLPDPADPR